MSTSIIGIPTSRVSDSYIRQRLLTQVQFDQAQMFRIQTQLSTGRRFEAPSEDPVAAQQVMNLQSLLDRKTQVQSNLTTTQSYLTATDSALGNVADLLTEARATALGALGTTATDIQRQAAAQQIGQTIQQLLNTGNQTFRGRYLFAGSDTQVQPFTTGTDGAVVYQGNEGRVPSYADINLLQDSNLNGSEVFGAISRQVRGTGLQPALTYDTRLADLREGAGISRGSIMISDGHSTSTVDLSSAETIGDVAALVRAHPPAARSLEVEVNGTGLTIRLNSAAGVDPATDNLSVREVGGGTTASQLGIFRENGVGPGPLVGDPLAPALRGTTALGDILGTHAMAFVHFDGRDNDIIVDAKTQGATAADGTLLNGVAIAFVNDAPAGGQETVDFDPGTPAAGGNPGTPGSITVHVKLGETRAYQIVAAINNAGAMPFTARLDPLDATNAGHSVVNALVATQTAGGSGTQFDQTAGLQIVNHGQTYTISLATAKTVEDLLNAINGAGAGMLAEINQERSGLNVRSRTSGADFMIGESGGSTAAQLGVRTFTDATYLKDLNFGRGVQDYAGAAGIPGTDFTVTLSDNTKIDIDIAGAQTIGGLRQIINTAGGGRLRAELNPSGNGIELIDDAPGAGAFTVTCNPMSTAAVDLGLVPPGSASQTSDPDATLTGSDVNPQETDSVFNALLRLRHALDTNDTREVQRAVALLDNRVTNMNFSRAELGIRQQGLDVMQQRLETEQINLKQVMSDEYDVDMAQAISDFTGRQLAYQASLQAAGRIFQYSLLNYL